MDFFHFMNWNLTHFNAGIGSVIPELAVRKMTICCKNKLSWGWKTLWSRSLVWEYIFSHTEVMPTKRKNCYKKHSVSCCQQHLYSALQGDSSWRSEIQTITLAPLFWQHIRGLATWDYSATWFLQANPQSENDYCLLWKKKWVKWFHFWTDKSVRKDLN